MNVEKIIKNYIPQIVHMSLATSKNNVPWACEVHFAYDDELNLYFFSRPETRHCQEIAENPNVAGTIVTQHFKYQKPRGVYFEGEAHLITEEAEYSKAYEVYNARLDVEHWLPSAAAKGGKFYKIVVKNFAVYDAYESTLPGKHELAWNGGANAGAGDDLA